MTGHPMTLTLAPDDVAAWQLYELGNRRACGAYESLTLFACRNGCGEDFASLGSRRFHERGCGK